jgi:hypothetical protein
MLVALGVAVATLAAPGDAHASGGSFTGASMELFKSFLVRSGSSAAA